MRNATHTSSAAQREPLTVGTLVACPDPECGQAAEVVATWIWPSTWGAFPHVRTRCVARHVFTPPADTVVPLADDAPVAVGSRVTSGA